MKVCTSTSRRNCDHLVNTGISKSCFLFSTTACLGASTQIRVGAASSAVRVPRGRAVRVLVGKFRLRLGRARVPGASGAGFALASGSGNFLCAWELVSDLVWFQRGLRSSSGRLGGSVRGLGRIL